MLKKTIVIDLGGSILSPKLGQINFRLLSNFKKIIRKESRKKRFIVVVGGGGLCRAYQNRAREINIKSNEDLDWLGIRSTQLNAEFLRVFLGDLAFPELILSEKQKINWKRGILVSGGWQPGHSTDYIAMKLAKTYKAEKVIIGTNIDYLYDSDPKKDPKAKKIKRVSWSDFYKTANHKWEPGMNAPLDPKAARLGKKIKIPLLFLNGKNLPNLAKAIQGKPFRGSTISG
ncbi:MAG: UMP kinase [Candidatus Moraniibacteriota bacterium]